MILWCLGLICESMVFYVVSLLDLSNMAARGEIELVCGWIMKCVGAVHLS